MILAVRAVALVLSFGFLLTNGQTPFADNWTKELLARMDTLNKNLHNDIRGLNQRIQENVNGQLQRAHETVANALKTAKEGGNESGLITIPSQNGQPVIILGNGGRARVIQSTVDDNGQVRYVDKEDVRVNNTLFHTERVYNATSKSFDEQRYTLDLSDPNAQPKYVQSP